MFARTSVIAVALSALVNQASAAPAAPNDTDLQCMLVASALGQNKQPGAQSLSSIMAFYYLGRLDARTPGVALGPALRAEVQKTAPQALQVQAQKCVATMKARAGALQALNGLQPTQTPGPGPSGNAPSVMPTDPAAPPAPQ
jgi:hypothetical protein